MLQRLRRPEGSAKGFLQLVSGTAIGLAAAYAVAPILTRIFSVADFGVVAAYTASVGLFSAAVSLRYEQAIVLAQDEDTSAHLVIIATAATFLVVGAMLALSAVPIPLLDGFAAWATLKRHPLIVALGLIGAGLNQIMVYWALRDKFYADVARNKVAQALTTAVVQLAAGAMHLGALGLMWGDVCGRYSGNATLARLGWRRHRERMLRARPADLLVAARTYWRFPVLLSWASLVNAAGVTLPVLFMTSNYGVFVAGQYGLVDRVAAAPSGLLGRAAGQVYSSEASEAARSNPALLPGLYLRRLFALAVPAVFVGALYMVLAPWLFATVFGGRWHTAGVYARILTPATVFGFVAAPLSPTLVISGRPALSSMWDVGRLIAVGAAFGTGMWLSWGPEHVLAVYSAASVVAYGAMIWACYWATCHPRPAAAGLREPCD